MPFYAQTFAVASAFFLVGCVIGCGSSTVRLPASFKPKYDSQIVTSLKSAALNGVLFQVSEGVFRDVPIQQVDNCRKTEAPNWTANFMNLLDLLNKNPQYYGKFHVVDFKRGDKAKAEISRDIDGLSYLNITYAKRETRDKVTPATRLPCSEGISEFLGKDLVTTFIDWPNSEEINSVLKQASAKAKIERFKFNTEFLVFLAEHQTILKIAPEVAFERSYEGEYFLGSWLEKMAQELRQKDTNIDFINYWLKEIGTHSNQATTIEFFGLHPESSLSYGVQVDTVGRFSRKLNNYQEPTYLFMSYRQHNGAYVYNSLADLNKCLQGLMVIYSNALTMGTSLESDNDSFLAPGYSCKPETKD
ncbi:MAG TPA: hypothetical protein VIG33_14230 [Pseudobdellovibrionaceae bacterium]|jgi:hypothetical protein